MVVPDAAANTKNGRRVRFTNDEENSGGETTSMILEVYPLPPIDEQERGQYWYSKDELQDMLVVAIQDTGRAAKEARLQGKTIPTNEYTLRGLESLSRTWQVRKQQSALERVRVIQAYNKQHKQSDGKVIDQEAIRKLYQSYNAIDTKRAIAFGKLDAQDSYWFESNNPNNRHNNDNSNQKSSPITMKDIKGMFGRMLNKHKQHKKNKR